MSILIEPVTMCDVTTDQQWTEYELSLRENPHFATREEAEQAALALDHELERLGGQ